MTRSFLLAVLAPLLAFPATAQPPAAPAPKAVAGRPWFVDDEKFFDAFMDQLTALAKDGKCLPADKLTARMKPGRKARITPTQPGEKTFTPEEVYRRALPSVLVIGSVHKDDDGDWVDGLYATAWVVAADGVLVTNWHVFEDLERGEVFGAVDHKGNVYPVIDFLGGDKLSDVAVVRIDAKGLTPLPLADTHAGVGAWVGVLGHPGDNYFVYTQGTVTRYSTNKNEEGRRERWMGVTAEYAGGSSGSPVLDARCSVVGMAALTLTIGDTPIPTRRVDRRALVGRSPRAVKKQPPVAPPPREKGEAMPPPYSGLQMILKMAVPSPTILRSFGK
jgi:S1-C subfamily serine protease